MRLLALVLAACAAAAPLRAGETRVGGEARASAAPVLAVPAVSLPGGSFSLSAIGLPASLSAAPTLSAEPAGAVKTSGAVDFGGPPPFAGSLTEKTSPGLAFPAGRAVASPLAAAGSEISAIGGNLPGRAFPVSGASRAEIHPGKKLSPAESWSSRAALLGHARGIAAALGLSADSQDVPLERGRSGGPGPLRRASAAESRFARADGGAPPAPAEPDAPRRPLKRLFGPALAAALTLLPSLVHANPFAVLGPGPKLGATLPLILLAAAIALVRLPVTKLLVLTNPHSLGPGDGGSDGVARLPLAAMPLVVFFYAAIEEFTFRAVGFMGAVMLLLHAMPALHGPAARASAAGVYAAAALLSSWVFAISHRYSELWPRFIGGLVYCAALVMTGNLLFPTLIHAFYNLTLFLRRRAELRREESGAGRAA